MSKESIEIDTHMRIATMQEPLRAESVHDDAEPITALDALLRVRQASITNFKKVGQESREGILTVDSIIADLLAANATSQLEEVVAAVKKVFPKSKFFPDPIYPIARFAFGADNPNADRDASRKAAVIRFFRKKELSPEEVEKMLASHEIASLVAIARAECPLRAKRNAEVKINVRLSAAAFAAVEPSTVGSSGLLKYRVVKRLGATILVEVDFVSASE